jgi:hypothetical protein
MATDLDILLDGIDPSRNFDILAARADNALNTFPMPAGTIVHPLGFQGCLARFYCHLENHLLNVCPPRQMEYWLDWGRAIQMLRGAYGPDGEQAAMDMAVSGADGGIYSVLKDVSDQLVEMYARNEISARVAGYLNHASVEQWLTWPEEYILKYGHLLPAELLDGNAVRIKSNFHKVLTEHPKMIRRLRRVGR